MRPVLWRCQASRLVAEADELVGYSLYIDLLGPLAAGKPRQDFPLGGEEARCRYALEEAGKGKDVALICSGDAGIYAMGALVFELLDRGVDEEGVSDAAHRVEVISAPGVSALQAAAARAGAPLGHDFCAISRCWRKQGIFCYSIALRIRRCFWPARSVVLKRS